MKSRTFFIATAALTLAAHAHQGADPRGDHPGTQPSTPEQEKAMFHLPPGFEIQLVAAEPEIQKPINITFDGGGRLWVSGSEMYPWPASVEADGKPIPDFANAYAALAGAFHVSDKAPPISNVARDTVRILSDFDENGHARKISVFADGLNIPSGVQPLPRKPGSKGDTAIVYSIPNIWRLEDTTGNGHADKREVLYGTAGFLDTHGGMSSFLYWIDGWIYGTHGFRNHSELHDQAGRVTVLDSGNTYRFRPDGSAFEIYAHGQTNPFGLTVDPLGNFYTADSHSRPIYMLLRGGWYEGIGKQHDGLGFAPRITDDDHGSTAIGGIVYYADNKWPEEYRGNTFNGNVVTQMINRDRLDWHGSTPVATRMPDFLTSDDPWFRPVQVKLGPDGALWVADFYNPIIAHYEVPLTDPNRDHAHGRIWRIVYRGDKQKPAAGAPKTIAGNDSATGNAKGSSPSEGQSLNIPDLATLNAGDLLKHMADPNIVVRTLATNELVDRLGKDALPQIRKLVGKIPQPIGTTPQNALETPETYRFSNWLWAMQRLGQGHNLSVSCDAYQSMSPAVLAALARITSLNDDYAPQKGVGLANLWADRLVGNTKISFPAGAKRAFVEGLASHPAKETVQLLVSLWKSTPGEDSELIHAVRMALRDNLVAPGGYAEAAKLSAQDTDASEKIADVSLGAPTPDAAEYLLGYLQRTKLASPRAGEYLRHAALNIAPARIGAVAALVDSLDHAPLAQRLSAADGLSQAARQRGIQLPDAANAWLQRTMVEALGSSDGALLKRAIESVRQAKIDAKFQPLSRIVDDTKRPVKLRVSALEAIADLDQGRPFLTRTLAAEGAMQLRKRAAELLSQNAANPEVAASLLATLPTAPGELASAIGAGLATTDDSCAKLLAVIEAGKASPTVLRNVLVTALLEKRPQALRARAAVLTKDLPPEDERLDKVIAARADAFEKAKPDPIHGAQVFQQTCSVCHRFKNIGAIVGPQLDGIKTRGVHRVIEDILDPNRNVDPMFRQTIIETADGQTIAGLNVRIEGELLTLTDPTGKSVSVPKAKVKSQIQTRLSLMPPGFESVIPSADFNDLLSYLMERPRK